MHLQSTPLLSNFLPSKRLAYAQQCMFLLTHIKDEINPQLTSYFHMIQVLNLEFLKENLPFNRLHPHYYINNHMGTFMDIWMKAVKWILSQRKANRGDHIKRL